MQISWLWHTIITTKSKYQSWVHCAKSCPESRECQNRTTSGGTAELLSSKSLVFWQLPARKQIYLSRRNFYFYHLMQMNDAHIHLFFFYTEKLVTIIFVLKYTLKIKTKPTLDRQTSCNHMLPSEIVSIIQHQDWISLIKMKKVPKHCSDLQLNLITRIFILASWSG